VHSLVTAIDPRASSRLLVLHTTYIWIPSAPLPSSEFDLCRGAGRWAPREAFAFVGSSSPLTALVIVILDRGWSIASRWHGHGQIFVASMNEVFFSVKGDAAQ